MQNFLKIGLVVPEHEDPEKWHFPLKAFIALTTVLHYRADCDLKPEGPAVADKPARRETMRKSAAVRRLNKLLPLSKRDKLLLIKLLFN